MSAGPTSEPLAELVGVHKRFGHVHALRGIDLQIRVGEILALLGPNSAGKTTAISILLGRRRPDRGRVTLFGCDPRAPQTRRRIGATPQETGSPNTLTVAEVVELVRAHFQRPNATEDLLAQVDLVDLKAGRTGGLSGGQRRGLAVAVAFAGNPEIVFLDEPTTGLDVGSRHDLWQAIRDHHQNGGTVLLTTHNLEEAQALATRISVIARGQIVARAARTRSRPGPRSSARLKAVSLPGLPGIARMECADRVYALYTPDPDELIRALVGRQVPFRGLEVPQSSLEEAILDLGVQCHGQEPVDGRTDARCPHRGGRHDHGCHRASEGRHLDPLHRVGALCMRCSAPGRHPRPDRAAPPTACRTRATGAGRQSGCVLERCIWNCSLTP